jgi:hypothetical protein
VERKPGSEARAASSRATVAARFFSATVSGFGSFVFSVSSPAPRRDPRQSSPPGPFPGSETASSLARCAVMPSMAACACASAFSAAEMRARSSLASNAASAAATAASSGKRVRRWNRLVASARARSAAGRSRWRRSRVSRSSHEVNSSAERRETRACVSLARYARREAASAEASGPGRGAPPLRVGGVAIANETPARNPQRGRARRARGETRGVTRGTRRTARMALRARVSATSCVPMCGNDARRFRQSLEDTRQLVVAPKSAPRINYAPQSSSRRPWRRT